MSSAHIQTHGPGSAKVGTKLFLVRGILKIKCFYNKFGSIHDVVQWLELLYLKRYCRYVICL